MAADAFPNARVVLQQSLSASLQVQPANDNTDAHFVHIAGGIIIYVCFLKGATHDTVEKTAKSVLNARLSESADGKRVSVLELPGDVLIIPQATLGGNLKGRGMQYHRNISKEDGAELYAEFVQLCKETVQNNNKSQGTDKKVESGTYGNRQVFRTDTNGPYTHVMEF